MMMRSFCVDKGILKKEFPGDYFNPGAEIKLYYKHGKSEGKMGIHLKIWILSTSIAVTCFLLMWIL